MTKAARLILEAVGCPDDMSDIDMKRQIWATSRVLPMILDTLEEIQRHDAEQDEYIFILKLSHCAAEWISQPTNIKHALIAVGLVINAIGWICYVTRWSS